MSHDTSADDMIDYMLNESGFDLSMPKMVLSITGGSNRLLIDETTKTAFKQGLIKMSKTINAWIISGGTNCGVMRLVGDAVEQDIRSNGLSVIGIAPWGCVSFREDLIVKKFFTLKHPFEQYLKKNFLNKRKIKDDKITHQSNGSVNIITGRYVS